MNNNNTTAPWVRYVLLMGALTLASSATANSRYYFMDNKTQTSFPFETVDNLIVMSVSVNDMDLNLILDTGMRSIVLFGKRFERCLETLDDITVRLSGYGRKKDREGKLSIGNNIVIEDVLGTDIGIVIMPTNLFKKAGIYDIDGIIGYEIFSRFIVEINYIDRMITLYEPGITPNFSQFDKLPLVVKDTKPYIPASLLFKNNDTTSGYYHLDTGSAQDIMLFADDDMGNRFITNPSIVGLGIGGTIRGFEGEQVKIRLSSTIERSVTPKYIRRQFSNRELTDVEGSIGSAFLKDMVVVLDYVNKSCYIKDDAHGKRLNYRFDGNSGE